MTSISNIWKQFTSILSNLNNLHSLEVVDRVSETQLQVGENSDWIIWRLKAYINIYTMATKGLFSIWNNHKCLSYLFPLHLNTYVMGLQPLWIFNYFCRGRGSALDVRFGRLRSKYYDTQLQVGANLEDLIQRFNGLSYPFISRAM